MIEISHPVLPGPGRLYCGPRPFPPAAAVAALVRAGIGTVACLLSRREAGAELWAAYREAGLALLHHPIRDFGVPDDAAAFARFLTALAERLEAGERVYLHCGAGLGRTGTALACLVKHRGYSGDPVQLVREIYVPAAVESPVQQRFVTAFPRSD
ncbi:MAG: hypothetical protein L0027_13545 [Candidatus Rokubacteria bacterium]|nr:hypothetical protein [Candidatus Rokubacteria bacterium]